MKSILGRFLALCGAGIVIYSLFIPVILMEFPVPSQKLGDIVVNLDMQVESSLYELGSKLGELDESGVDLPKILDYLWLIFMGLAVINGLLALKPEFPRIIRGILGLLPIALLGAVVYKTAANPDLNIGFSGLIDYFTNGFYILLAGTFLLFLGGIFIDAKSAKVYHERR